MREPIEILHGSSTPTYSVIWLHGLGATADDFVPVIPYLGLKPSLSIRFVFPQAPARPITLNGGYVMPGWYDIKGTDISDKEDLKGITESKKTVEGLIAAEIAKGIPSVNIALVGFSQGGAVAYYSGLRSKHKLAGILGLSTYLPFSEKAQAEHSGVNIRTPIMAMHGIVDDIVPLALGKQSQEAMAALGYSVGWKTYDMPHSVIPEQLVDIGGWFNQLFS